MSQFAPGSRVHNPRTGRIIIVGKDTWSGLSAAERQSARPADEAALASSGPSRRSSGGFYSRGSSKGAKGPHVYRAASSAAHASTLPIAGAPVTSSQAEKGWRLAAPRTLGERVEVYNRCGASCFLAEPNPTAGGPASLGFPVCTRAGKCQRDARALHAAERRAKQYGHTAVANLAHSLLADANAKAHTTNTPTTKATTATPPRRSARLRESASAD